MNNLLIRYQSLLSTIDQWFTTTQSKLPDAIVCVDGCCGCCRGLFDISLLDARLLRAGFDQLPAATQMVARHKAQIQLQKLQKNWPDFSHPYILNLMKDSVWIEMPENDLTPCPLLDENGHCLVYDYRPMTCRLHGLPQIDSSGEIFLEEWCSLNFVGLNPLDLQDLRHDLHNLFHEEFILLRTFAKELCALDSCELDTFIPLALLIDFGPFDWKNWGRLNSAQLTKK